MKLRILQSIDNDNYNLTFSIDPTSVSSDDSALFAKYGAQPIDFGGTINVYSSYSSTGAGIGGPTDTFVLPDAYFDLPSGFPVQMVFNITSPSPFATSTTNRLNAYRLGIQAAVTASITTLRGYTDNFSGEFIANI